MGIGDVTLPLAPCTVEAMKKGADEMGVAETFRGYEDSGSGYDFLKKAIAGYYAKRNVSLELDEIKVNDGNTFVQICPINAKVEIVGNGEDVENIGNTENM